MTHVFDPVSASKKIGIISNPIGTLEETKAAGYDISRTACCYKSGNGIYGCGAEQRCPFTEEGVGDYTGVGSEYSSRGSTNFKLNGPRMLGVQVRTARNEGEKRFQRQMPCYNFVKTMLSRMQHGMAQAVLKKDAELIQIVSVEGDGFELIETEFVPVDAAAYANGTNRRETPVDKTFTVMPFPRPGQIGQGREQSVQERLRQQEIERAQKKRAYFESDSKAERENFREHHARQREEARTAEPPAVPAFELDDLQPPSEDETALLEGAVASEAPSAEPVMRPSKVKP